MIFRPFLLFLAAVTALGTGACSDFSTEPDRYPAELRLTPDTLLVSEGEPVAFELEVLDQDGVPYSTLPSWAPPAWSTSHPELLQLEADGTGVATGPGEARTIARLAGLETRATVRANPREIALDVPLAYVTQSTQRHDGDVVLLAGREALVRVFVTGSTPNFFRPAVRVTFSREGAVVHTAFLEIENSGLPVELSEGDLRLSYDAEIPGEIVAPGLSMRVEVDPEGVVPVTSGSALRFPAAGDVALDVRAVPPFRIRMVPVQHELESEMTEDLAGRVLRMASDLFPLNEFDLDVREPYRTSADLGTEAGWEKLIFEIAALRIDDGSDRYYYGGFQRSGIGGILGLGFVGYPVAIGDEGMPGTIAHEIGHNFGLRHAPCGNPAGVDRGYPYPNASIGTYGYDRSARSVQVPDRRFDLMSYCDPVWISDYNYEKVLAYRDTSEFDAAFEDPATGAVRAPRGPTLLVGGGVYEGRLVLEPALDWNGEAILPAGDGEYRVEGLDADGGTLFSYAVEPMRLSHRNSSIFLLSIPAAAAQPERLARLRLAGPEGVVERVRTRSPQRESPELVVERRSAGARARGVLPEARWEHERFPMAVVRDRATGQVLGMYRGGRLVLPRADAAEVDVVLSDGVGSSRARVTVR